LVTEETETAKPMMEEYLHMNMSINKHATRIPWRTVRVLLIAFLLVGPITTYSQNRQQQQQNANASSSRNSPANTPSTGEGIVRPRDLDQWMYARIVWIGLLGGIAAFLLSWFYLTKLSFGSGLETERRARRIFSVCLFFIALPLALLMLYADMYFYRFTGHLAFTLLGALFGLQGLLLTATALLAFTVAAALTARLKPLSRCPYMLWPKPQGRSQIFDYGRQSEAWLIITLLRLAEPEQGVWKHLCIWLLRV
jgi:hypothetical protein